MGLPEGITDPNQSVGVGHWKTGNAEAAEHKQPIENMEEVPPAKKNQKKRLRTWLPKKPSRKKT
jgi:hypothetical protein